MSKPKWLIDREMHARRIAVEPDLCGDCRHFGRFTRRFRYHGEEWVDVRECDAHPNCLNIKYSICCDDFERK